MKRIISKLTIGLVVVAAGAWASPLCTDQTVTGVGGNTLDKYIALGAGGCTMNNLLFSNFAYSYTLGTDSFYVSGPKGTGANQPSTSVTVAVDGTNTAFSFGGNWVVNHYQTANLSLTFTVSAPSNLVTTLQNTFTANQAGTQNGGPTSTVNASCSGATCGPTDFTNAIKTITGTHGPLTVSNTAVMNAQGSTTGSLNLYHLSIIKDQFAATAPPTSTPEPATYGLMGLGIGVFAWFRRRK